MAIAPSSRMESVYRADFHANTSSLTYHYLVRALRIFFFFYFCSKFLKKYSNSLCIVYEFCLCGPKHRNGFSQSQATPYDERGRKDGSPAGLWSNKTIPEEWDTDWPAQKPSLSIYAHWWDGDIEKKVYPLLCHPPCHLKVKKRYKLWNLVESRMESNSECTCG